jgi:glycosyltransferase involved in cell wall biosynthesis
VVACQGVPDIYPALERLDSPPPLIEFGDQVSDVKTNPKHLTVRFVADSAAARRAAQKVMDCPEHIVLIPPMVDLNEFNRSDRGMVRKIWGLADDQVAIGWVGRLERKRRVEDFIQAAALVHEQAPQTHFMVIGGLDAFQPGYAGKMRDLAQELGIADVVNFLGDRGRVARLLPGLDALVWLSHGEGMPHVIPEAGAAYLPVVATCDEGSEQQITDGENGLLVPDESPEAMAAALRRLVDDSALRETLGRNLHQTVEQAYSAKVIVPRWAALFDEVLAERGQVQAQAGV